MRSLVRTPAVSVAWAAVFGTAVGLATSAQEGYLAEGLPVLTVQAVSASALVYLGASSRSGARTIPIQAASSRRPPTRGP